LAPRLEPVHEQAYGGFAEIDLYPDVRPALGALRDGGTTVVIAGNQPRRRREQLAGLQLPADVIATSDDLGVAKPDAAFFARVCALAGDRQPTDVLYVGDRIDNDVVPAARAGLRTAWLRRGPWGHLQTQGSSRPDLVLTSLTELPHLLAGARRT
jgi:FMN phosphatase YigB (HAD superfamily)